MISTIPTAVLTGASIVVFGLITIAGAKIWIENKSRFSNNKNLIVASVTIILGAGNFELLFGSFNLGNWNCNFCCDFPEPVIQFKR